MRHKLRRPLLSCTKYRDPDEVGRALTQVKLYQELPAQSSSSVAVTAARAQSICFLRYEIIVLGGQLTVSGQCRGLLFRGDVAWLF